MSATKASALKSELGTSSSASGFRAMSPLSTYLVLYLFLSAQVISRSSAAQKFYPNGRYGRRSDLPPLMGTSALNKLPLMSSNSMDSLLNQDISMSKEPSGYTLEEYVPMWCTEIDRKSNLFKCFDRLPLKLLKQSQELNAAVTRAAQQDQEQQS